MPPGMLLLFPAAKRPDLAGLRSALADQSRITISHAAGQQAGSGCWVELLVDGMTFDLLGLAPGAPVDPGGFRAFYDPPDAAQRDGAEALLLRPGPHLAGGARTVPVLRGIAGLAAGLAQALDGVIALSWQPAESLVGAGFFRSTVDAWLQGGPFPALGMTSLLADGEGGMVSLGLEFIAGQELRLEPALCAQQAATAQLAVRLVNQLVAHGKLERAQSITAHDGTVLRLVPSADGRYVLVRRG